MKIEADEKHPNMYRARLRNGQLTDMVNLSRAKDAVAHMEHTR